MTRPVRPAQPSGIALAVRAWLGGRHYQVLLVALIAFVIAQPLWLITDGPITLGIFLTILLTASLLVTSRSRITENVGLIIGMPMIGSMWVSILDPTTPTSVFADASAVLFFFFVTYMMLRDVLSAGRVTRDTLYGAACVYLLLAVTFALAYSLIGSLDGDAFTSSTAVVRDADGRIHAIELVYFSLVTLTTLGYGDITPVSPFVRALASLEAVTGVLYSALLVARLVGMYAAAEHREKIDIGSRSGDPP